MFTTPSWLLGRVVILWDRGEGAGSSVAPMAEPFLRAGAAALPPPAPVPSVGGTQ